MSSSSKWRIRYYEEAKQDFAELDGSARPVVVAAIRKAAKNPLPFTEGGYGKPLTNKCGIELKGFGKIKLRKLGIRIVYKLARDEHSMTVVAIAPRADEEVYRLAARRARKRGILQ